MAYDRIMDFPGRFADHILPDKIHVLNVCFTVNGMVEKFGGTAGNIAYTLRLLGERPLILSAIGKDYAPYFERLKACDLPFDGIRVVSEEFTACAYITTDRADNQITGFNPGAMKHRNEWDFADLDASRTIALLAPGNLGDMAAYADRYREKGVRFICDPGQSLTAWRNEDLAAWLKGSYALITNDYELELVMKMTGRSRDDLLLLTEMLITTLGEEGSLITTREGETRVPAVRTDNVVDPIGAGDAFRAGFIKGIVTGRDLASSAKMGAVAATYAITHYGTQEHSFTWQGFLSRYQEAFGSLA